MPSKIKNVGLSCICGSYFGKRGDLNVHLREKDKDPEHIHHKLMECYERGILNKTEDTMTMLKNKPVRKAYIENLLNPIEDKLIIGVIYNEEDKIFRSFKTTMKFSNYKKDVLGKIKPPLNMMPPGFRKTMGQYGKDKFKFVDKYYVNKDNLTEIRKLNAEIDLEFINSNYEWFD